jgi:hypothetical protein
MRVIIVMLLLPALIPVFGGCAYQGSNQAKLTAAQSNYNAQDDNECRAQGNTTGSETYVQCRQALAESHVADEAAQQAQREADARAAEQAQRDAAAAALAQQQQQAQAPKRR